MQNRCGVRGVRSGGFTLVELISALAISLLIFQVMFAAYLVLFRLWDAQVQDNLTLMHAGEVTAEIEYQWQRFPGATVALHQIKFQDVTYELDGDKLIKTKNQIAEMVLNHLDPNQSSFSTQGDRLTGQLLMNLKHENVAFPLYARILK